jgi:[acyl-carrier-protein] S-malonyltransferase
MAAMGISDLYEVGPGKVLAGLTKRIDKSLNGVGVFDPDTLKKAMERSE